MLQFNTQTKNPLYIFVPQLRKIEVHWSTLSKVRSQRDSSLKNEKSVFIYMLFQICMTSFFFCGTYIEKCLKMDLLFFCPHIGSQLYKNC